MLATHESMIRCGCKAIARPRRWQGSLNNSAKLAAFYLVNGIKLQGQIESFDQFVVLLKNTVSQMVYKHAISTVVPSRVVRMPLQNPPEGDDGGDS